MDTEHMKDKAHICNCEIKDPNNYQGIIRINTMPKWPMTIITIKIIPIGVLVESEQGFKIGMSRTDVVVVMEKW